MNGKLCLYFILITFLCLTAAKIEAQDHLNVTAITQYYHNWSDGVNDVAIDGSIAYLACGTDGLHVVGMSEAGGFTELGHLDGITAYHVKISGIYAFVGTQQGIQIVDIHVPQSPTVIGGFLQDAGVTSIRLDGHYAYVSQYDMLKIVDIADPTTPEVISSVPIPSVDVEIQGDRAYVSCREHGLRVLDLTDKSAPQIISSYECPTDSCGISGIAVKGGYGYLAAGPRGFAVMDLTTMEMVAGIDTLIYAYSVQVIGNFAYLHYGPVNCPLAVIDISNPLAPQTMGIYRPMQDLANFVVKENTAYVADHEHGLRIVDVSNPTDPVETRSYSRYGFDDAVKLVGNYAYVLEPYKLKIIDISDVHAPHEVGYYESVQTLNDFAIQGDVAYVAADGDPTIAAVDISNPASPCLIGRYESPDYSWCISLALNGHYLYASEWGGFRVLDVANPRAMQPVGFIESETFTGIAISGQYAFVSLDNGSSQLAVVDISDPANPFLLTSYRPDNMMTCGVAVADGYVYGLQDNGMVIFSATDFSDWRPLSLLPIPGGLCNWRNRRMSVASNFVYVPTDSMGLCVIDVSNRFRPTLTGYYDTPGNAVGIAVSGNVAVVADLTNLGFYDCSAALGTGPRPETSVPGSVALLPNYPNPFNSTTQIAFDLPTSDRVTLRIFDLLGRGVATLTDGDLPAGRHTLSWSGTDASGMAVASGQYYVRLQTRAAVQTRPITLLK
jgi:hypothetical protein